MDVEQHLPEGELGSEVVKLALTRLGDPYSQPKAGQDDFTDCSYLVQWVYRQLRINLPRTAAEQARFCVENDLTVSRQTWFQAILYFGATSVMAGLWILHTLEFMLGRARWWMLPQVGDK